MSDPRFLPPKGKTEHHMATTDGHSCVVYDTDPADGLRGTIIAERFRRIAIGDGCGIVGLEQADDAPAQKNRTDLIVDAIAAVVERDDTDDLEGDGRPKVAAVSKEAGFKVTKTQFEEAWPKFVDSIGDDEGDD